MMMSDFAPEVAKYSKSSPNPKLAQNSVQVYCLALLSMQLVFQFQSYVQFCWSHYLFL